MAKVTNTTNLSLYIGKVEIKPRSTVEVPDDELAQAKKNKVVASWFASQKLALGDTAATKEAATKGKLSTAGTPPGAVRPKVDTNANVSLGGRRKATAPPSKPATQNRSAISSFFGKDRHSGKRK